MPSSSSDSGDRLSKILEAPHIDNRRDIWLWLHLHINQNAQLRFSSCNGPSMRDEIAKHLKHSAGSARQLRQEMERFLLPKETLAWIRANDDRQYEWLEPRLYDLGGQLLPRGLVNLTGRDLLLAMIDIDNIDITEKDRLVRRLHERWLKNLQNDIDYQWFADKKEGKKRCACAGEWAIRHAHATSRKARRITNYQELLIFFDQDFSNIERTWMIREIKKRWNRKQFDERNSEKKQINVILPKDVIAQLDVLAKKHNTKRAQIIEALILQKIEVDLLPQEAARNSKKVPQ